jgi:PAS domain S-box-containing protein
MHSHAATALPWPGFLNGGGECAALIAARDWSATLGPLAQWPAHLRAAVAIVLRSPVAMVMLWGDQGIMLYNDAYSVLAGRRHPALLGKPVHEGWPEEAAFNDNVMKVCLAGGTLDYVDKHLIVHRRGETEEVWLDLAYSPILDEAGQPGGVLAIITETTGRVLAQRRARDGEAKLLAAAEQLPIGISLADLDSAAVFYMNRAGAQIVGTTAMPRDMADYANWGAFHADGTNYRPDEYPLTRAALHGAVVSSETMHYRRPDGRAIQLEVSAARVHDDEGRPLFAVCAYADITERFESEQQLRENESRLRRAYEAGGIGSYEWDMVGGGGIQSDSMLRLVGFTPGRNHSLREILSTVHPDDIDRVIKTVAAIGKGADRVESDYRVRLPDGSVRYLQDIGQLERDAGGRPLRWVGVIQDVTERSLVESRLRENEERLRLAAAAAQMGTWDLDLRNDSGQWDDAALHICGIAGQDPQYDRQSWLRIVHPADRGRIAAAFDASLTRNGATYDVEFRAAVAAADGRERWMTSHGVVIRDNTGRPLRAVGILRNVTTRQREMERLRQSEERLLLAEDAGGIGVYDWDLHTNNVICSPGYFRVWGLSPDDSTSYDAFLSRIDAEQRAEVMASIAAARASGQTWSAEVRTTGRDGRQRAIVSRGSFVIGPDGTAERMLGVCFDITARKAAELALRELNDRLESEVERRTEQLLQAQDALRQSQKMEALGQLTGGVAHDFNNLLGAVVGSFDIIRRAADNPDKVRRFAGLGLAAADRGARLTGQLLAFSRAQRIELKPVDVSHLVQGMQDLLARTLGPMISLLIHVSPQTIVRSDPTQLELALLNLAINSRDAMPAGGRLTIACQPRSLADDAHLPAGAYIELTVADTGDGMPPDVAARAFDPFFTTKALGEGTGLGLSQVHGIVRQSGGDVRIESRPGEGTIVRLLLPQSDAQGSRDPAAERVNTLQSWSGTVLVIDDDPAVRETLAGCLDLLGLDAVFEADGAAGLARLATMTPRLLILDYAMPGMTGAEVATRVRALWPGLPIIFCTGYSDSKLIDKAAGTDVVVLRKPFRLDDLGAAVSAALGRPRAAVP